MEDNKEVTVTAGQMRAARALVGVSGERLAVLSGVSLVSIRRAEGGRGTAGMTRANADAIRRALEVAGVEFIPENGGGAGVRMKVPVASKGEHDSRSKAHIQHDVTT